MPGTWTEVDHLIRALAAVRRVAPQLSLDGDVRAALDHAIVAAAEAIDFAIDAPANPDRLLVARDALGVCAEMVLALDSQRGRALRSRNRDAALRERAVELIEAAQAPSPGRSV